jgi:acyl carrier protein
VPRSWTREEVWEEVRQILIEQLGLRPEEVVKDARLNEDIRLD